MNQNQQNIIKVFRQADEIDYSEGCRAFSFYKEVMQEIAAQYNKPLEVVTAIFAATSPNCDYVKNLRSTVSILAGFNAGLGFEQITVATYRHAGQRAFSYLTGVDFWQATKGKKIRNFYQNILHPESPAFVTIDGHCVNIWKDQLKTLKSTETAGGWKYETVAGDYKEVARRAGLLPNQLQAVCWFTWKRINRILYKPQLPLFGFDKNDIWQTRSILETIKPFPVRKEKTEVKE